MKTSILNKLTLLFVTIFSTSQLFAAIDYDAQDFQLRSILEAERQTDYFRATFETIQASADILNELRIDQVVATTESKLVQIQKEVIASKNNQSASASLLFGLISLTASRSWDVSKIMTMNPVEVSSFPEKVKRDFQALQGELSEYIRTNELALIYAKVYTLKAIQMTLAMSPQERTYVLPHVKRSIQFSQQVQFFGWQNIATCISTDYAERSSQTSLNLGGFLGKFGFGQESQQFAHNETTCSTKSKSAGSSDDTSSAAKLRKLDMLIASYAKALSLKELTEVRASPQEFWGL
jgi:hypothetical protein